MQISIDIDICLSRVHGKSLDLLVESLMEAWHQSGATSQDYIVVQVDLQVCITLLNRLPGYHGQTAFVQANYTRVKDCLSRSETLPVVHLNDPLVIWQFVRALLLVQGVSTCD